MRDHANAPLIVSLQCRNVRALQDLQWPLSGGSHLLLGGTGEGKTSLLEAVYLAVTTRSFRTARVSDCLRAASSQGFDEKGAGEEAEGEAVGAVPGSSAGLSSGFFTKVDVEGTVRATVEFGWSPEGGSTRRLNGESSSLEDHLSVQPMLAWSGAEIDVLIGSPERRRRLIDRLSVALRPETLRLLARYRKTLEHKRALLSQGRCDQATLSSFNTVLAQAAASLIERRAQTVELLRLALRSVLAEFPREQFEVDMSYCPSPAAALHADAEALGSASSQGSADPEGIERAMEQAASNERRLRRPTVGPHRDRIDILFRSRAVAETASAGERKAIGLLLFAAQAQLLAQAGRSAVLLIDDVDTEMDQATLEAIWPLLNRAPQTLFSSNREPVFENLQIDSVWRVANGSIEAS